MAEAREPAESPGAELDLSAYFHRHGPALVKVAWLAIGLGLLMEALLLILAVSFGTAQSVKPFVAEMTQKITWSFVVCVGLAIGKLASKSQLGLAGLLGLISAPLGFELARAVHRGAVQALQITVAASIGVSPLVLAVLKGVEYGGLGLTVAWLARRPRCGVTEHIALGLLFGLTFGTTILMLTTAGGQPISPAILLAWAINELLFPIGCSLILYATSVFGSAPQRAHSTS